MRAILTYAALLCFVGSSTALANPIPDPARSTCGTSDPTHGCQYLFGPVGTADALVVSVTVRDAFDLPMAACSTSATIIPNAGTLAFCTCSSNRRAGHTDAAGVVQFVFDGIGGRGALDLEVTTHCYGAIRICGSDDIQFTSPDLSAGCEPLSAVNIIDVGIWAGGLPPSYSQYSDYNCSGLVDVIDLGIFAGGLGTGCEFPRSGSLYSLSVSSGHP